MWVVRGWVESVNECGSIGAIVEVLGFSVLVQIDALLYVDGEGICRSGSIDIFGFDSQL